jgi:hypothetical protein
LLRHDIKYIILDFSRVSEVDSTGINILIHTTSICKKNGVLLLITSIKTKERVFRFLKTTPLLKKVGHDHFFNSTDEALSWAEDRLLDAEIGHDRYSEEIPLGKVDILENFTSSDIGRINKYIKRNKYSKNNIIFNQGDSAEKLFFLLKGRVVMMAEMPGYRKHRIGTLCQGIVFGEMAVLDSKPRSVTILAERDVVCGELSIEDIRALKQEEPDIFHKLLTGLALELSKRIRFSNKIITELRA